MERSAIWFKRRAVPVNLVFLGLLFVLGASFYFVEFQELKVATRVLAFVAVIYGLGTGYLLKSTEPK